jgi:hypothetical protein
MAAALLIILMVFLVGSVFLMLSLAYRSMEEERTASAHAAGHLHALNGPRFFANLGSDMTADPAAIAPALVVQRLEEHVRQEQRAVAEFANEPSMDRLFPDAAGIVDMLTRELEHRLRHDIEATSAFVAEPSVEGLFRGLASPIELGPRSA